MRYDFEIEVPPIDNQVRIIHNEIGSSGGVRMTGGGFGGCVVALVLKDQFENVRNVIHKVYPIASGYKVAVYRCAAKKGAFAEKSIKSDT